ncbi:MAG: 1-acyl-sn-glycerol-3-phosphate acyltransferase [Burkholderiales bacterium]|nr:1-acyl-sn-glycerol-3-phosphate acyltransferase [Burkholderiales bacterium]
MSQLILVLRSLVFMLLITLATVVWAPLCFLFAPLPYKQRYYWTGRWNAFVIWAAKVVCGIRYEVRGLENLPAGSAVFLSKHQSAWETIFYLCHMPRPLVYVFKKEITYIPFFGWGIALLRMIPIDRKKRVGALAQILEHGKNRLASGLSVIMFPEGTRIAVGEQGRYKGGGALLAVEAKVPVVPIAMNSGECWAKNSFVKKPGLITVSIGKPILPDGLSANEVMQKVENWIESEMRVISPQVYSDKSKLKTAA